MVTFNHPISSQEMVQRAYAAWFRSSPHQGLGVHQPAEYSGTHEHGGKLYVKLENQHGTLCVFRIRSVGGVPRLKRLKRWPAAIEAA